MWNEHKKVHKKPTEVNYNPWPSFKYTGTLRPYPLSVKRIVPPHIPRPDYADHELGYPLGEIAERGSTVIKVLNDEEIEGMRLACRVSSLKPND